MSESKKYINREGWLSILGNIVLFGLKYWAGVVTGSLALIADAWHTLSDSVSSIIVLIGGKISRKPADDEHPFGHGRAEHIASVIIGVLLALIAFDFVINAVRKFSAQEQTVFGTIAWVATIVSILVKEGMAQYAFWAAKKADSSILKADGWHHRTDALSSVVILVGIALGNTFWWTDAVLSFIVALMIGWASYQILATEIKALLGESPSDDLVLSIRKAIQEDFDEPLHLHHIHLHNYGRHTELSCHIKLPPDMTLEEAHEICTKVERTIMQKFGFYTTVHPEPIEW
ncbi:cation diffusion facilitator family transporter [Mariniphaga anaerophila]|uniref:Cation diffusion facilitator family transporter n=1 Tax=Mariniphaga anaerophila TaxID=1484053 RepID=A0A1M5BBZ7_9BACT|nr:cation diffusion facilitator family transporter [Mariniphaga anaerophila]SHF39672.1 cation diffusion facilitator family transporter [Mariniphaga anaerophila]